jgi:hypothetical protein
MRGLMMQTPLLLSSILRYPNFPAGYFRLVTRSVASIRFLVKA